MTSQAFRFLERIRNIDENAADVSYDKPKLLRKIRYSKAIAIASLYQTEHPEWFVCGSLALMLTDIIKPDYLSDIDFVTNSFPKGIQFYTIEYHKDLPDRSGYYHCEYRKDIDSEIVDSEIVDLFIHTQPISAEITTYSGLRVQNIQDVIEWKKYFNRNKDVTDLMQIYLPESLFEI